MKVPEKCQQQTTVSLIKFEEGASKAVFRNARQASYRRVCLDKCAVTQSKSADAALYDANERVVIIELKGADVNYGAKQVLAAAEFLRASDLRPTAYAGIVVGKQYPKITTSIQKTKNAFASAFRGPLHVVTKNGEFEFAAVCSFNGPHRE